MLNILPGANVKVRLQWHMAPPIVPICNQSCQLKNLKQPAEPCPEVTLVCFYLCCVYICLH